MDIKLPREFRSVKIYLMLGVVILFVKGYLDQSAFSTMILALVSMREMSSAHSKYIDSKTICPNQQPIILPAE